jgi:hypothetical protein
VVPDDSSSFQYPTGSLVWAAPTIAVSSTNDNVALIVLVLLVMFIAFQKIYDDRLCRQVTITCGW